MNGNSSEDHRLMQGTCASGMRFVSSHAFLNSTRFLQPAELRYEYSHAVLQELQSVAPLPNALRRAVLHRQVDFLAGRICALRALKSAGIRTAVEIPIGPAGAPQWPAGYTGSISHCDGQAIAVAAESTRIAAIGIDMEKRLSVEDAREVADQIMGEKERALRNSCPMSFEAWVSIVFSAKESFFKALYRHVGYRFDFHDAVIERVDSQNGRLDMQLVKTLSEHCRKGMAFSVQFQWRDDRVMTLCIPGLAVDTPVW